MNSLLYRFNKLFNNVRLNEDIENIELIIFSAENEIALSHLNMWLPFLIESKVHFVCICTNYKAFIKIKICYPTLNVIYVKNKDSLSLIVNRFSNLKACLYLSNIGKNINMIDAVNQFEIKHIFIGHGDSDKSASAHKFFRIYDEIWTAGEAGKDRFLNKKILLKHLIFKSVGNPRLKSLLQLNFKKTNKQSINILYLPTWTGVYKEQDYSSLSIMKSILAELQLRFSAQIIIKFHPRTEKDFFKDLNLKNSQLYIFEKSISELLPESNIYICDISASVSEALAMDRPIFLYIPKNKNIDMAKSNMEYKNYTYTFSDKSELISKMEEVLNENDYLKEGRALARQYILGEKKILKDCFIHALQKISFIKNGYSQSLILTEKEMSLDTQTFFYCASNKIDKELLSKISGKIKKHKNIYFVIKNKKNYFYIKTFYPKIHIFLLKEEQKLEFFLKEYSHLNKVIYLSHTPKNIHCLRYNYIDHNLLLSDKKQYSKSMRVYENIYRIKDKR